MHRCFALGLLAIGCGQPLPPVDLSMPCTLELSPLDVPLGGHATLSLPAGSRVTSFEVTASGDFAARRLDATSFDLKAPYRETSAAVSLALRCGDAVGGASVDAKTRTPKWSSLAKWSPTDATKPATREYGVTWLDGADRLMIYGGFHYRPMQFTTSNDLWAFDLNAQTWTSLDAPGGPKLAGGRIAQLPGTRDVLFLGGIDDQFHPVQHLDRLDPVALTWTAQPVTGAAAVGDYQPGLVWDSKRSRFLSVCGQAQSPHCKVSQLTVPGDGTAVWQELMVDGTVPPGRAGHFFAYDSVTDRVIVFAGAAGATIIGDTWALELNHDRPTWKKLFDEDANLKRRNGAFALDLANHRLIVWGGTYDGSHASPGVVALDLDEGHEAWKELATIDAPPDRASGTAVYDSGRRAFIGGFGNSLAGDFADLWSLAF